MKKQPEQFIHWVGFKLTWFIMRRLRILLIGVAVGAALLAGADSRGDVVIAQLSDTHLGEKHSPQAAENLRKAVEMINARHPDALIVSGDIGERPENREEAKTILKGLAAPVYYVPGNHEFSDTNGLAAYRKQFGPDYYRFQVKNVEVLALDSELLGNYAKFDVKTLPPPLPGMAAEAEKMFAWMGEQEGALKDKTVIAVQHIPLFRDQNFPDAKPYWIVSEPYARRETDMLHRLGVKHLLAGHWHNGRVFSQDGITIHVAPATSWLPLGGRLGFAMHTITADGDVRTEFVPLPAAAPGPAS
jgi:3',5'-cyclic-AMP phosphodiesterase